MKSPIRGEDNEEKKTQDSYGKINKPSLQNLHINQAKME